MIQLYTDYASDIRVVAYTIMAAAFLWRAALSATSQRPWYTSVTFLTGIFWLLSLHFALTRNPSIPLVLTTPTVVLLAVSSVIHLFREK